MYRRKIMPEGHKLAMPYEYDVSLNMHALGPGQPAIGEWQALGLPLPDMQEIRSYRLARICEQLQQRDIGGILLYDPLNVRYATDTTNMQLWSTHNAARYCYVSAEGKMIVYDYHMCEHLSAHNPLIDEVRPAQSWFYFANGERLEETALPWSRDILQLVADYNGGNSRLAIDKINPEGAKLLQEGGITIVNGERVMEQARKVKCEEELRAMRCAMAACNVAIDKMKEQAKPGMSENQLWAILQAESICRGSEWVETRILASGPRTNPWFQECSSRVIEAGDILAFDTDLVGSYGMCIDISRSWLIGSTTPTDLQRQLYEMACEQVNHNIGLLKPGLSFVDFVNQAKIYPESEYRHYVSLLHGVGLCDEYPSVGFMPDGIELDDVFVPGMVVSIESYLGKVSGGTGMKIEQQGYFTEDGFVVMSDYPMDLIIS